MNCGATPVDLMENELFGHECGTFTDAVVAQPGLIDEAEGNTLFLDESDCQRSRHERGSRDKREYSVC